MIRRFFFLYLVFTMGALFEAHALDDFNEELSPITAPLFKAQKDEQIVFVFGTVHELPLTVLKNAPHVKESLSKCQSLFVENNYMLVFTEAKKRIPVQLTKEGKRRIEVVFQRYGSIREVEAYDLYSQVLALSYYGSLQGMDSELIREYKKPIFSLDAPENRRDHEKEILEQYDAAMKTKTSLEESQNVLNKIYQQELEKEPRESFQDLLIDFADISNKLIQKIPLEYEESDPDNTRERTKEWIKNSLAPYFIAHPTHIIGIVVGAYHVEDLMNWLKDQEFKINLEPSVDFP
jgi:hypothetical protein